MSIVIKHYKGVVYEKDLLSQANKVGDEKPISPISKSRGIVELMPTDSVCVPDSNSVKLESENYYAVSSRPAFCMKLNWNCKQMSLQLVSNVDILQTSATLMCELKGLEGTNCNCEV